MQSIRSGYLINYRLIILVEKKDNIRIDSCGVEDGTVGNDGMSNEIRDFGSPRAAEGIKVNIIINKFLIPILLSS